MRRRFRSVCCFLTRDLRTGTGVAEDPAVSCVRVPPSRREAGVTLIEALVVLAILGLVTAIVAVPINSYWQRSRLQSAAGDIRTFLQVAYTDAVTQHAQITVNLYQGAGGSWSLERRNPLKTAPDDLLATYTLPDFVSLALNPAATASPVAGWPALGAVRSIICDTMSLTLCPVGYNGCDATSTVPVQVTNVRTLSITHVSMVDGSLTPNTRYDIQVLPVWNVSYKKVLL